MIISLPVQASSTLSNSSISFKIGPLKGIFTVGTTEYLIKVKWLFDKEHDYQIWEVYKDDNKIASINYDEYAGTYVFYLVEFLSIPLNSSCIFNMFNYIHSKQK